MILYIYRQTVTYLEKAPEKINFSVEDLCIFIYVYILLYMIN